MSFEDRGQYTMRPDEVAAELGVTTRTLQNWRREEKGPPYTQIGQTIIYGRAAFQEWLNGTSD